MITDLEIELHPAVGLISQKTSSTGFLKLHLKVVLSVVFNPDFEDTMDIRSANCLKQMERIVGLISSKGFNELPPAWIRLFNSLNTISSLARAVAEVGLNTYQHLIELICAEFSLIQRQKLLSEPLRLQSRSAIGVSTAAFYSFRVLLGFS